VPKKTLYQVRKSKEKGILFKIDFEKVINRVNWAFLFEILKLRGFGKRWIN
jgi:hypothetical protein